MEESVAEVISGGGRGNHESGLLSIEPVLKLQELIFAGVDTVNDPCTGGTTQLSNLGQYHFTDGFGNYRTTDDPNYTPEKRSTTLEAYTKCSRDAYCLVYTWQGRICWRNPPELNLDTCRLALR